ncbi:TPA: hypothetical protein KQF00_004420, partial [Clostridioides difficile]|nr:hypothetical protein [Clostridioides difficile]
FTKEFVNNIKDMNDIHSVRISFIVDVTLTYNVFLDDWNNIKNNVNLIDDLDFSSGN